MIGGGRDITGGHRARLLMCALVAASIAAAPAAHAKPPKTKASSGDKLVTVIGPPTYAPIVRSGSFGLRVPLAPLQGVAQSRLRAALIGASVAGRGERAIFETFSVRLRKRGQTKGHGRRDLGLVIRIAAHPALDPGLYRVRTAVIDPQRQIRQRLTFTVKVRRPMLRQPEPIVIKRTVNPWPFDSSSEPVAVPLRELSGRSWLSGITVSQTKPASSGDDQASGTLKLENSPQLQPRGAAVAQVAATGSFPLGTSKGEIEIDGRQLPAPVSVAYEVHSNAGKLWLVLLLAGSIALGWLTRVGLTRLIRRGEAQAQGHLLHEQMSNALHAHPDRAFREAVRQAVADLEVALDDRNPARVRAAVKAGHEKLDAELKRLKERGDAVAKRLSALATLIGRSWAVPPSVEAELSAIRSEIVIATTRLDAHHVDAAESATSEIETRLATRIATPAREWRDKVSPLVEALRTQSPNAPGSADQSVRTAAGAANTALANAAITASDASAKDLLTAVHAAKTAVGALLPIAQTAADATVVHVVQALGAAGVHPAALEPLQSHREAVSLTFEAAQRQDSSSFAPVVSMLATLGEQLRDQIRDNARQDADHEAMDTALERGDFVAAAVAATTPAATQVLPFRAFLADMGNLVVAKRTGLAESASAKGQPPQPVSLIRGLGIRVDRLSPLQELELTRRAVESARQLRSMLLGIAVLIVGYLFFADSWVGTTDDVAKVFLWGFTAQLTGDFVVAQLTARKPTTPAAPAVGAPAAPPAQPDPAGPAAPGTGATTGTENGSAGTQPVAPSTPVAG
jgi:hypothetical protein